MRKTLSLFTIVFFVFSIFVYGKSDSSYILDLKSDANGIVLGESEEATTTTVATAKNPLPINEEVITAPKRNDNGVDYDLKDGNAAVMDCTSGSFIYNKDSDKKVAIASITKLATALVFLKKNIALDTVYEVKKGDRVEGGLLHLRTGDLVEVKDLLNLSLIASDNMATKALVDASGVTSSEFVTEMNQFAKENNLNDTSFMDEIGLSENNLSTASDVAKLANLAFANETISGIVSQSKYLFTTKNGRPVTAKSTNVLLGDDEDGGMRIIGGKTGFTNTAGYCFVGKFIDEKNKSVISVVLNEGEKNSRFYQAKNLAKWAYDNFSWGN